WEDMWTYHAIAAVIRGHSILRGIDGVDADRIGVTGISWGGYLTCVVSGVDDRFACAVPVYGCGFLQDNSAEGWMRLFEQMSPERRAWWHDHCDPSVYLSQAKMPMMFVTGTNDFAYPLDSLQKSYQLPKSSVSLCIRLEMAHGHQPGWKPEEIGLFVDHCCRGGEGLPQIGEMARDGDVVSAKMVSEREIVLGELIYTCDTGFWPERKWHSVEGQIGNGVVSSKLPNGCRVCYLAVEDDRGAYANAPHLELV
ncbi:MAG: prolyl oligopeptidase family serine peptidase, partial [Candidatus Latescibacteria bacterium]|nr:prolyl oligopeptidase family serine peptidase [Candidatus Latescibacterota bacterium]